METDKKECVFSGKWTKLILSYWKNNSDSGVWEYITRKGDGRGIVIISWFYKNNEKYYILIKQKRIPFEDYIIEFPAGLVDENEEIEKTALRELEEETGAKGKILSISPPLSTSAGLTDEVIHIVFAEVIDFTEQHLEGSEDIETIFLKENEAKTFLKKCTHIIDSKVWLFLNSL